MKKLILSALIALPMTVAAAETYKIFSVNQSTNFFEGSSGGDAGGSLGETGPGPTSLDGNGDEQAGFYGETPTSELYSGTGLASEIGLTAGTVQHDTSPWLKFAYEGKVLYVAKKPYRNDVSWDDINAVGAVYGGKTVSKNGNTYKVRLLRCAANDPTSWVYDSGAADGTSGADYDPTEAIGSEWNELIYRIHQDTPTNQEGSNWTNYADSDIIVNNTGDGDGTWCQETPSYDTSRRVNRGDGSLSHFGASTSSFSHSNYGWRPVLELQ